MILLFRLLLRLVYGFRAYNESVLKTPGPVLLIPNHVSWLDWVFLGVCLEKDWKFVTSSTTAHASWIHRKIMLGKRAFPVDTRSPYAVKHIAEYLRDGGRLVLFAEGRISLTGSLMKLFEGTGFLLLKTEAKIITCYLRGADRLKWTKHGGWTQWFPRLSAHFSEVLEPPHPTHLSALQGRTKLTNWLRDQMVSQQFEVEMELGPMNVLDAVSENQRRIGRRLALKDITFQEVNYRRLCVGAALLSNCWRAFFGGRDGERIGVLLPNVNATPVTVLSLWVANKVPTVLNFSTGVPTMLTCAKLAGLKVVITSRTFIEKARLDLSPFREAGVELVFLEDVQRHISAEQKILELMRQRFFRAFPHADLRPHDTAAILFTSGSEGVPKGVELSHRNLMANIQQMLAVIDLTDQDRIFNALPLFHSFGLTIGTLLPLVRGVPVFLYPSPLHYRVVPNAVYNMDCTVLLATNTFLNGYARKAHSYDFQGLKYLFAGAEKTQEATFNTWSKKYGVRILEGYGATECSPCIAVNTKVDPRFGTTGKFLPGIQHKLEPITGVDEGGRLFVRGPNVMKGYINPDANKGFRKLNGWYDTGDIVRLDEDGYVHILGRLKRFAKVSGEMVSLTAIEDALAGAFPHYGLRCEVAIFSRPDEHRGEVLIAVANEKKLQLNEIRTVIRSKGFTNLCVPREVIAVRNIPKLGTGKIHHRELEKLIEK